MAFGNGIQLAANFDMNAQVPLDNRTIFATEADMNDFGQKHAKVIYTGMVAFAADKGLLYVWTGDKFIELLSNSMSKLKINITDTNQNTTYPWALTWGNLKALLSAHGIKFDDNVIGVDTVALNNMKDKG